jgi:nucleotide-binding universal stress UspA family protein
MDVNRILFPTDFSHASDAALTLATSLARDSGATLMIVHVEEPPMAYGGGELYYGELNPARRELRRMLEEIRPTDPIVNCEHHLINGAPAGALVQLAMEKDADLIVMGTHGRTGIMRILMGSVAEAVVRRATCPVLTYREPAGKTAKV